MSPRTNWRCAGALALAWMIQLGCAAPQVSLAENNPSIEPREYDKVFRKWTRELHIIPLNGLENVLTAKATYLGAEFRSAFAAKVASDRQFSQGEREQLQNEQAQALAAGHEFFVSVMSGLELSDELDPERGDWSIRLVDDRGRQVLPREVVKVKKPTYTDERSFDFDPVHRTAYRLTFPLAAEDGAPILSEQTRFFTLNFASSKGQGEMRWEVAPPQ